MDASVKLTKRGYAVTDKATGKIVAYPKALQLRGPVTLDATGIVHGTYRASGANKAQPAGFIAVGTLGEPFGGFKLFGIRPVQKANGAHLDASGRVSVHV